MDIPGPTFRAGGTISPCRAVTLDVSNDNQVVQVSSTSQFIIGIAQEGQRNAPGVLGSDNTVAANQGDQIDVRTIGRVALVEIGSAVTRGDKLVADANGRLNTIAAGSPSTQYVAGIALESGSGLGVRIRMQVIPQEVWF
jgi:Uncharacterized conserved protein (DUF2190)